MLRLALISLLVPLFGATVIDRVSVVVDDRVIKASDIEREIRVTSFLNRERLDLVAASRKQAVNRLIDQEIIRREIAAGGYAMASDGDVDKLINETLRSHSNLAAYGLTREQLREALRWQLTVVRFMEQRFPQQPGVDGNDPFVNWLDNARKSLRLRYKQEELK